MYQVKYSPSIASSYMYMLFPALIIIGFLLSNAKHGLGIPSAAIFMIYGVVPMLDKYISQVWVNPTLK
jgi:hypothetical protein